MNAILFLINVNYYLNRWLKLKNILKDKNKNN